MSETISYPILDEAIVVLENNRGIKVEVQGYTDSTGTDEYNLGLSQRRAEAVESSILWHRNRDQLLNWYPKRNRKAESHFDTESGEGSLL